MSNILSEVHPELVAEWSDKNLPLTPDRITYGSTVLSNCLKAILKVCCLRYSLKPVPVMRN